METYYLFRIYFPKKILSLQSMNISAKKLVKRLFVNIDVFENSKTETQTYTIFFLTSFSDSNSA